MSDPAKYRTKEEVEDYKQKDPIEQVRNSILTHKIVSGAQLEKIDIKVKEAVAQSVKFAEESSLPPGSDAFTDVYTHSDYPFVKD